MEKATRSYGTRNRLSLLGCGLQSQSVSQFVQNAIQLVQMKIGSRLYGYPASVDDTNRALARIANLGLKYGEIEAFDFGNKNINVLRKQKEKSRKLLNLQGNL